MTEPAALATAAAVRAGETTALAECDAAHAREVAYAEQRGVPAGR